MAIPETIRKIMDIIQEFPKELAVVEGSDTETGKAAYVLCIAKEGDDGSVSMLPIGELRGDGLTRYAPPEAVSVETREIRTFNIEEK